MVQETMTKQEKIGEVIERHVRNAMADYSRDGDEALAERTARYILIDLHSQGLVLKVEHWLPTHSGMVCTVDPLIETGG